MMAEQTEQPKNDLVTDKLAEFTDRVLQAGTADDVELRGSDSELEKLQETVLLLKRAGVEPPPEVAGRIRARLMAEWPVQRVEQRQRAPVRRPAPAPRQNWWERWYHSLSPASPRTFALGFAMVAAFVLAVVLILPQDVTHVPATALGSGGLAPFGITVFVVLAAAAYWLWRGRR
jgi:hypothetical protein